MTCMNVTHMDTNRRQLPECCSKWWCTHTFTCSFLEGMIKCGSCARWRSSTRSDDPIKYVSFLRIGVCVPSRLEIVGAKYWASTRSYDHVVDSYCTLFVIPSAFDNNLKISRWSVGRMRGTYQYNIFKTQNQLAELNGFAHSIHLTEKQKLFRTQFSPLCIFIIQCHVYTQINNINSHILHGGLIHVPVIRQVVVQTKAKRCKSLSASLSMIDADESISTRSVTFSWVCYAHTYRGVHFSDSRGNQECLVGCLTRWCCWQSKIGTWNLGWLMSWQ